MGIFRFKRFAVKNERSAMKVNTDGVLLGAAMTVSGTDRYLLDIGTGTGTIALIAAQRLSDLLVCGCSSSADVPRPQFHIDAIDIDKDSASEAAENFAVSPWRENLFAKNVSLSGLETALGESGAEVVCRECGPGKEYDLIFSNPPYFESALKAPDERRCAARHAETLSYRDIMEFSAAHLKEDGRLSVILPAETETELLRYAAFCGLFPFRIVRVKSTPFKEPYRIIAEFSRKAGRGGAEEELLVIQDGGRYTREYCEVTHEFLLNS